MTQSFCTACKRIYHGDFHNCLKHIETPPGIIIAPSCHVLHAILEDTDQSKWYREVKKVCNSKCPNWGKRDGSVGCLLSPTKPCDVYSLHIAKGKGCLDEGNPRFKPRPKIEPIEFPDFKFGNGIGERAIVTVMVGDESRELGGYTLPLMEQYAERCGADLVVVDVDQFPQWPIANKFVVRDIARRYDRTLFLDIDCWVRPFAPVMFDVFERGHFWLHRDLPMTRNQGFLQHDARVLGHPEMEIECLNSGVVLMDRSHARLWRPPRNITQTSHTLEQTSVEIRAKLSGASIRHLPLEWNCQYWFRDPFWDNYRYSHIVHLAGAKHKTRIAILKMLATESSPDVGVLQPN